MVAFTELLTNINIPPQLKIAFYELLILLVSQ